eukprot:gene2308-12526_t
MACGGGDAGYIQRHKLHYVFDDLCREIVTRRPAD